MKERAQEALRQKINAYLSASPSRSIPQLAKKASVGEMTVRRISQGECTASLETMLSLLKIVATDEEMREIVHEAHPLLAASFEKIWGKSAAISEPTLNEAIKTHAGCYIVNMASTRRGTSREEIQTVLGRQGLRVLEQLMASGHLVEKDNIIHLTNPEFTVVDTPTAVAQLRNLIDMHRIGTPGAAVTTQTESVNEEGLRAILDVFIEAANRVAEIRQDPKYNGKIPFFFGAFLNRFENLE